MTRRPAKPKTQPRPCMAIATERDLCGRPARIYSCVFMGEAKAFVPVYLCRRHGGESLRTRAEKRGGR